MGTRHDQTTRQPISMNAPQAFQFGTNRRTVKLRRNRSGPVKWSVIPYPAWAQSLITVDLGRQQERDGGDCQQPLYGTVSANKLQRLLRAADPRGIACEPSHVSKVDSFRLKHAVFWDVTPSGSCKTRRFGGSIASIIRVTRIDGLGTLATRKCS
jgi:hypothetical protein